MNQSEIWYADLNQVTGSEQQNFRPVVFIRWNSLNKYLPIVIAYPLTTKMKNPKGNIILEPNELNGLSNVSGVMIFHVRSISSNRLKEKLEILHLMN
ncbi:MAG: type II toxin-antitoxin system PemK/MazF family toxin [Bacteroidales bacterium]